MPPVPGLDPATSFHHWIAVDLRFYREQADLSLAQMGKIMGATRHGVSNIEHAREGHRLQERHAKALDTYFGLNRHFELLVTYARRAHNPNWQRDFINEERRALSIWSVEPLWVVGLLQTPAYVRAVFEMTPAANTDALIKARLRRQALLDGPDPPELWVIQDEAAISHLVGGADVMREQLAHLLEMGERPNISLRIVPLTTDAYPGQNGAFTVLELPKTSVGYYSAPTGGRLVEEQREVRSMLVHYHHVSAVALPENLSREMIKEKMNGLA